MSDNKLCPMDKPYCIDKCQWYMNGECAVKVIAKSLSAPIEKPKPKSKV